MRFKAQVDAFVTAGNYRGLVVRVCNKTHVIVSRRNMPGSRVNGAECVCNYDRPRFDGHLLPSVYRGGSIDIPLKLLREITDPDPRTLQAHEIPFPKVTLLPTFPVYSTSRRAWGIMTDIREGIARGHDVILASATSLSPADRWSDSLKALRWADPDSIVGQKENESNVGNSNVGASLVGSTLPLGITKKEKYSFLTKEFDTLEQAIRAKKVSELRDFLEKELGDQRHIVVEDIVDNWDQIKAVVEA